MINLLYQSLTWLAVDGSVDVRAPINESTSNYTSLADYVSDFYIYAIWLIAAVSIIMIVIGGYTMIISQGNPDMINKGRGTIISALVSLALLVLAYTVLRIISPQIINNPAPTSSTVETDNRDRHEIIEHGLEL
ncbi:MAG: hypothetical protein WC570_00090 [Patescibacteria group bacterium]